MRVKNKNCFVILYYIKLNKLGKNKNVRFPSLQIFFYFFFIFKKRKISKFFKFLKYLFPPNFRVG